MRNGPKSGKPGPGGRTITFTLDPREDTGLVVEARELTPLARAAVYLGHPPGCNQACLA